MRRAVLALVPFLLIACTTSPRIPEHLVEVGPGVPISIDLVSFDPSGLLLDTRSTPRLARLKVRVSNSSRDDLHVVQVNVIQDMFGIVKLEPAMAGFNETIRSGDAHVFDLSMYGEAVDQTQSLNDALNLRIDVFTSEGDGYFTSVRFSLMAPPRER